MSRQILLTLVMLVIVPLVNGVISIDDVDVKRDVLSRSLSPALGGGVLRILCLGASITNGYHASDKNGYRDALRKSLVKDGHIVNMIGSLKSGTMEDNDVEGWVGYKIAEVGVKAELSLPHFPNIVLIHVGTNDMDQNHDVAHAGERLAAVVDRIFVAVPGVTIIVSTLLPARSPATEANTLLYNAALARVVSSRSAAGKRITLVDMHSITDIGADGIHPTDAGYLKMATVFYNGILSMGSMIQPPAPVAGVNDGAAPNKLVSEATTSSAGNRLDFPQPSMTVLTTSAQQAKTVPPPVLSIPQSSKIVTSTLIQQSITVSTPVLSVATMSTSTQQTNSVSTPYPSISHSSGTITNTSTQQSTGLLPSSTSVISAANMSTILIPTNRALSINPGLWMGVMIGTLGMLL